MILKTAAGNNPYFPVQDHNEIKNILIIGGSSGIGNHLAHLITDKYRVYATYNKNIPIPPENDRLSFHSCNVTDKVTDFSYLPELLHGIVYCPGSIHLKPFARIEPEEFINDYRVNVTGAVTIIQEVLPKLKASRNASVILFSTVAVQHGFNFHSLVAASKGAVEGLARALAAELAPFIRVNCIAPSITETPLSAALLNTDAKIEANASRHPLKRIGKPGDIAHMASFLLSEESSWMTGQILAVDGGMSSIKS
jgi:NAD(P)-dependent dehydrogenase (short-subunit alcohol dehydrogenase family)